MLKKLFLNLYELLLYIPAFLLVLLIILLLIISGIEDFIFGRTDKITRNLVRKLHGISD